METMPARILVVDDEPDIRRLYHRALGGAGFAVTAAQSGPEALDLLDEKYSAIVTDYGMAGMSGVEFVRAIRARGLETPVLIVSGEFDAGCVNGGLPRGIIAILHKPVLLEELLSALRRACGLASTPEAQHARSPEGADYP